MMTATLLVILMTIPGLALFYGGLVRSKNMLSILMQVFMVFALIIVLWCIYGYSLAFTEGNAFFGNLHDRTFLNNIWDPAKGAFAYAATFSKGVVIPEFVFVAFQGTFAAITCGLIVGAFAERAKFTAVLAFIVIWFTFAYLPMAHMVWFWTGPDAIKDAAPHPHQHPGAQHAPQHVRVRDHASHRGGEEVLSVRLELLLLLSCHGRYRCQWAISRGGM